MEKVKLNEVTWFQEGPGVRNTQYTESGIKLLNVANLVNGKVVLSNTSRYISEDVPQGLVMLEALGKSLDVPTPICTSLIEIATAALGRSMRDKGRTPEKLGMENIKMILEDCEKNKKLVDGFI